MSKVPLTKRGAENLQAELQQLKTVDRPRIIKAIAEARAHGDLKENAEYHAAREQQSSQRTPRKKILNRKDRAKRYHKSSIFNLQSSIPACPGWGKSRGLKVNICGKWIITFSKSGCNGLIR